MVSWKRSLKSQQTFGLRRCERIHTTKTQIKKIKSGGGLQSSVIGYIHIYIYIYYTCADTPRAPRRRQWLLAGGLNPRPYGGSIIFQAVSFMAKNTCTVGSRPICSTGINITVCTTGINTTVCTTMILILNKQKREHNVAYLFCLFCSSCSTTIETGHLLLVPQQ